ncbi:MAG: hypothetical protein L0338_29385, partial [Acidobacteria bacterium]|nr:hypothetical protein [Acidobacteriota bacterium]
MQEPGRRDENTFLVSRWFADDHDAEAIEVLFDQTFAFFRPVQEVVPKDANPYDIAEATVVDRPHKVADERQVLHH